MKKGANLLLDFYQKHRISPVHQNIHNFKAHLSRREKLYRQLGIPIAAFRGQHVLEVGPGSGFNSLALLQWGVKLDLVEPNPQGGGELSQRIPKYGFSKKQWHLYRTTLEESKAHRLYDIILAEGFIPGLQKRNVILKKLQRLTAPGGVVVVTCVDDIGFLFENLRRIIAHRLIVGVDDLNEQVAILVDAFKSHFQTLKYTTRPVEDWVTDQFLCPTFFGKMFSIEDCIREFGKEFTLLGASPQLFTDCTWYKSIDQNPFTHFLEQFKKKRHTLLLWTLSESERNPYLNHQLSQAATALRLKFNNLATQYSRGNSRKLLPLIQKIFKLTSDLPREIPDALKEVLELLKQNTFTSRQVSGMKHFKKAFGRGMQYVSMTRRFTS